jgi:hypothetical protein
MLKQARYLWLVYALVVLSACASLQTDQSAIGQRLNQAEVTATAALNLSTTLNDSRTITLAQHKAVGVAADGVFAAVVAGRQALAAGNATGAAERLAGVSEALQTLAAFYLAQTTGVGR